MNPAVVITDMIMPGTEKIETVREPSRQHPDVKIIAISGGGLSGKLIFSRGDENRCFCSSC